MIYMWTFFGFLIVGAFSGWFFKFLAALFEGIIILPLFGFKNESFELALERKPKRFITAIIFKNTIIGLANSIMILTICARYVNEYSGNYWLYFSLGVLWSLFIISDGKAFTGVFFWTSSANFVLMWFGFGIYSLTIVGVLTFAISIAYYYGRIGMIQQQHHSNETIDI